MLALTVEQRGQFWSGVIPASLGGRMCVCGEVLQEGDPAAWRPSDGVLLCEGCVLKSRIEHQPIAEAERPHGPPVGSPRPHEQRTCFWLTLVGRATVCERCHQNLTHRQEQVFRWEPKTCYCRPCADALGIDYKPSRKWSEAQ